jgi:hypothetical protein
MALSASPAILKFCWRVWWSFVVGKEAKFLDPTRQNAFNKRSRAA